MLKKILESLDGLDEKYHDLYEKQSDGKFHLKIEDDDGEELKRAKEHEVNARKDAEKKARELADQLKAVQADIKKLNDEKDDSHRKSGDVESLEASWQKKYSEREGDLQSKLDTVQSALQGQMVDNVARQMATKLAGDNADIIMPHIHNRLSVELDDDGHAKTRVLDAEGKASSYTTEELEKEFFTSERFAPIVVGSKAKGGGATGARGGDHKRKFSEMSSAEKVALKRKNPDEYRRLRDVEGSKQ